MNKAPEISSDDMTASSDEMWAGMAAKAQRGDKKAYNQLLGELIPFIKSVVAGGLANPDWIDEVVQEVLISVHKSLHTYSADRAFKPWLVSIIHFRKSDLLRKHYRKRGDKKATTDDQEFISQHVTKPYNAGELKDIEQALQQVSEKQRELFTLTRIEGYSMKEVANRTGMSVSAVKVSVHRTAEKLKSYLEDEYE